MTDDVRPGASPLTRRGFIASAAAIAGGAVLAPAVLESQSATDRPGGPIATRAPAELPEVVRALKPMTAGIIPITADERRARMERARQLMHQSGIGAVVLEPGSSLFYFTGVRWGLSERPLVAVLPAQGEIAWVCPAFEEQRARELIRSFGTDVRTWEEDESPYALIAQILRDRGAATGRAGVEERLRFFVFDGLRKQVPNVDFVSADPVTAGCRMIKSPAELALMERANQITLAAYRAAVQTLHDAMPLEEFRANVSTAYTALGVGPSAVLASFGRYTAFPHGSTAPQQLREGDFVLMDDGCSIDGYQADVTRTIVFGKPTQHQRDVWDLEKRAQAAAFAVVRPGASCEAVDAAARKVITDAGYGPGYRLPGLPHRTGHGIGLDGHEWPYLVRGNKLPLAPGMCFSDEPTISNYSEFGVRLEDCFHVTEDGAKFFTAPAESIDNPFGGSTAG